MVNRKLLRVLMLLIVFTVTAKAQVWLNPYNGQSNSDDRGHGIVVDRAGNIYTSGFTTNNSSGEDIILIKYSNTGVIQWRKTFSGSGNYSDQPFGMVIDNSDNIYITGITTKSGGNIDFITLKYNSNGDSLWAKTYTGSGNNEDRAWGIVVDSYGNVYVTGSSETSSSGTDIVTVKYSSNGTQLWSKRYDGPSHKNDAGFGIVKDAANNIYVGGYAEFNNQQTDYVLIKYTPEGTEQWVKNYNGTASGDDKAWGIVVDNSDNIYITGSSYSGNAKMDIVTRKYSSAGNVLWTSRFNGTENRDDNAFGMVVDNITGSLYVIGTTYVPGHGKDIVTIKYNYTSGETLWNRTYDGSGHSDDVPYAITMSRSITNPHVFVTGTTRHGNSSQQEDIVVISYSNTGETLFTNIINGNADLDDASFGIVVDEDDNFFISGYIGVQGAMDALVPSHDIITVKYIKLELLGIIKNENSNPESFKLYQNYPNPFNPVTNIKFDIAEESNVKLSVYDISGKEVGVLIDNKMNAGSYEVSFSSRNLASGIYFFSLNTGSYSEIRKMMLIK